MIAAVLWSAPAAAQINVRGYLDVGSPSGDGPLELVGDHDGFSFSSWMSFTTGVVGPGACNKDPNACSPGRTMSLKASATYDRLDSPALVSVDFGGSITLPAIAPTATVSASFTFSGAFTVDQPNGTRTSVPLAGQGIATVFLHSPGDPGMPNSWHVDRVLYQFDQAPLPGRWSYADVGDVGLPGQSRFFNGQFLLNGAGGDIWGAADAFHFLYSTLDHGTGVVARVDSLSAAQPFAKAGVMVRRSLDPRSAHVVLDVKPDGGVEFMTRATPGADTTFLAGTTTTFPVWLRLSVSDGVAVGLMSSDGIAWTAVGSAAFAGGSLGGLVVTSHDVSATAQAAFEEPAVGLEWPWYQVDVGATGRAGNGELAHQTYLAAGSGGDIWGTTDAFHFLYSAHLVNGRVVARVDGEQNTSPLAKAGVMIRGGTVPDAPHVILDVRPNGSVEFMSRATPGGATSYLGGTTRAFPVWLKLERHGDTITGSTSADGSVWTSVGSVDVQLGLDADAGVAVTSHDPSLVNTARIGTLYVESTTIDSTGTPPAPRNVVIYASDVPASAMHGVWAAAGDTTSPNATRLTTPAGGPANTSAPLAAPADYVDVPFTTATNTPYTLWMRVRAAGNSKLSDSLWVQFSDAQAGGAGVYPIGTTAGLLVNLATDAGAASLQNWGWVDGAYWLPQPATFTFSTTSHMMRIQPREYGVQIDQIVLSPSIYLNRNASCPPSCGSAPGSLSSDTTIVSRPSP